MHSLHQLLTLLLRSLIINNTLVANNIIYIYCKNPPLKHI